MRFVVVRQCDGLGRVVIPDELRRQLGIGPGDDLEFLVDGDAVILAIYRPGCVFCGAATDVVRFRSKVLCRRCACELAAVR